VDGRLISEIPAGLVVYLGVAVGDTPDKADYLAKKIANMRIFEDDNGKMNLSVLDKGYEILSVSQFTLLADTSHGNRPGFTGAEAPDKAKPMYEYFCERLASYGMPVKRGVFGADMKIEQFNDGPVTIVMEV
jgi:D-tyrosyl-tRNA(Tyr) deacylase